MSSNTPTTIERTSPPGKNSSAYKDSLDNLKKKARLYAKGLGMIEDNWEHIIANIIAIASGDDKSAVPAAVFLRDTFLGKPKEQKEMIVTPSDATDGLKIEYVIEAVKGES